MLRSVAQTKIPCLLPVGRTEFTLKVFGMMTKELLNHVLFPDSLPLLLLSGFRCDINYSCRTNTTPFMFSRGVTGALGRSKTSRKSPGTMAGCRGVGYPPGISSERVWRCCTRMVKFAAIRQSYALDEVRLTWPRHDFLTSKPL